MHSRSYAFGLHSDVRLRTTASTIAERGDGAIMPLWHVDVREEVKGMSKGRSKTAHRKKRTASAPKSGPVWHQTAEEATLAQMPRFNAHACGTGPHGDAKYNRARLKRDWQRELRREGTRNRGFLLFPNRQSFRNRNHAIWIKRAGNRILPCSFFAWGLRKRKRFCFEIRCAPNYRHTWHLSRSTFCKCSFEAK